MKKIKTSAFDRLVDNGKEDIIDHLDRSHLRRPDLHPKRVNVDFPAWMVGALDRESARLGITRQSLIKMWLSERLETGRSV